MRAPTTIITVATAGHVDHGKSALVRAMTGIEPDRLAEERRRGLTIDLGFAHHVTPTGETLSFIDVPGHGDFIHTMIAGVAAVDVVVLVVDAAEGVMPQTREHFEILRLLEVNDIVVALTRCDLVDGGRLDEVAQQVAAWCESAGVRTTPPLRTSAVTGEGLAALADRLVAVGSRSGGGRRVTERLRLHVDRAFTIDGAGTVVTGTLEGDRVAVGDELVIARTGQPVRIRSVQTHGAPVGEGEPGTRCALNLVGASLGDLERADTLVRQDEWELTDVFDARLSGVDPRRARGLLLHVGTGRHAVTIAPVGSTHGLSDTARLRVGARLALVPGDRFILRSTGDDTTVGGGVVLDIAPTTRPSRSRPDGSVESILGGHGWLDVDRATRLVGRRVEPVVGRHVAAAGVVDATRRSLLDELADGPIDLTGRPEHDVALVRAFDGVTVEHGIARLGSREPVLDHPCVAVVLAGGVRPEPPAGVDRAVIARLTRLGVFVEHDAMVFHVDALEATRPVLEGLWGAHPDGFTVSDLRVALGITRKHAVPLAVCLDKLGFTRRVGDRRVRGHRS
ncbi:MAG: selenocysteine-specific elongation factor [Actinomycetota bacterium]|jgi:selenocysteine-specific elongation factor